MSIGISTYKKHDLGHDYSTNEKVNKIFLSIERDLSLNNYEQSLENLIIIRSFLSELDEDTMKIEKLLKWSITQIVLTENIEKVIDIIKTIRLGFSESKVST